MKRFGKLLLVSFLVGGSLGGCSSAMDYTSSISDQEALRIGSVATPEDERNHLIKMLNNVKNTHRHDALREIEAR